MNHGQEMEQIAIGYRLSDMSPFGNCICIYDSPSVAFRRNERC